MKLLMHMCCAPCSTYPVEVMREEKIRIDGFFYNPNIHPWEEYVRRKENIHIFSRQVKLPVYYDGEFSQEVWERYSGPDAERCAMCYSVRMDRTASFARENGYDAFTTTLLVSPYQKHELIRELGEKYARIHSTEFFYRDFRSGFRSGQKLAGEMGLYRQKYCGCIISYGA